MAEKTTEPENHPTIPHTPSRLPESVMRERVLGFLEMMRTRRSVREFSPDPVPDEILDLAIEAASLAPSGANMQPWTFVVVRDPAIKREIRIAAEKEENLNYSGRMPDEWLRALAPLQTDWRKEFLEIAPALIVVFKQDWHEEGDSRILHYYVQESVGLACGFLLAALHSAGLASLTHTPSPMGFLRDILDRPKSERPFLLIPVGYPAEDCRVPDISKKKLDEVRLTR